MDMYTFMREFADSWVLLSLFLFFLYVCVRVFLPRLREHHSDAANSIFRNENRPLVDDSVDRRGKEA